MKRLYKSYFKTPITTDFFTSFVLVLRFERRNNSLGVLLIISESKNTCLTLVAPNFLTRLVNSKFFKSKLFKLGGFHITYLHEFV